MVNPGLNNLLILITSILSIAAHCSFASITKNVTIDVKWYPFPDDSPLSFYTSWPDELGPHSSATKWLDSSFKLWKGEHNSSDPGTLASFTCVFWAEGFGNDATTHNISDPEGFAFVISSHKFDGISNSDGQWLGLTNSTLNGNPSNQFIAVEIDSKKEGSDPDGNHLGLDINGINSTKTFNLSEKGMDLRSGAYFWVAVRYDPATLSLCCYLGRDSGDVDDEKLDGLVPIVNQTVNLKEILAKENFFGFTASTGNTMMNTWIRAWSLRVDSLYEDGTQTVRWIAIPLLVVLLIIGFSVGNYYYQRRFKENTSGVGGVGEEVDDFKLQQEDDGKAWEIKTYEQVLELFRLFREHGRDLLGFAALIGLNFSNAFAVYTIESILIDYFTKVRRNVLIVATAKIIGMECVQAIMSILAAITWSITTNLGLYQVVLFCHAIHIIGMMLFVLATSEVVSGYVTTWFLYVALFCIATGVGGKEGTMDSFLIPQTKVTTLSTACPTIGHLMGVATGLAANAALKAHVKDADPRPFWLLLGYLCLLVMIITFVLFACSTLLFHNVEHYRNPFGRVYRIMVSAICKSKVHGDIYSEHQAVEAPRGSEENFYQSPQVDNRAQGCKKPEEIALVVRQDNKGTSPHRPASINKSQQTITPLPTNKDGCLLRWLDKAAVIKPNEDVVTQEKKNTLFKIQEVEQTKEFCRTFPIWGTLVPCGVVLTMGNTFFVDQASNLNNKLGALPIPLSAVQGFTKLARFVTNEFVLKENRKLRPKVQMGIGLVISISCCVIAGFIERRRLELFNHQSSMSFFLLLPQLILLGAMDSFAFQGFANFLDKHIAKEMKSHEELAIKSATAVGLLVCALLIVVFHITGGPLRSLGDTIDKSNLPKFYWMLGVLCSVSFCMYVLYTLVSKRFRSPARGRRG